MGATASQITSLTKNIKAPRLWPKCGEFTGDREFSAQMASNAENVSIWWRHHVIILRHTVRDIRIYYLNAALYIVAK